MISFDLYCEIEHILEEYQMEYDQREENLSQCTLPQSVMKTIGLLEKKNSDEKLFSTLIAQCDSESIRQLIDYFPVEAPIQVLLKERLKALKNNSSPVIIETDENKKEDSQFYQYLLECTKKKGYATISDFYNYAGISRQRISKLRLDDSSISREFSLHMAVGLEYDYEQSFEFLKRAGYNFVPRNRRETIIAYVMRNQRYTFSQMEEVLYLFNEKTFLES